MLNQRKPWGQLSVFMIKVIDFQAVLAIIYLAMKSKDSWAFNLLPSE
jgi:hypothetical protein